MNANNKRLQAACYIANASTAIVTNFPPILFLTFRALYGISYSMIGLLVVINFVTQLLIDVAFSLFSEKFNIKKTIRLMPILTACGYLFYALMPYFFAENAYLWLVIGTVIFAASGGLGEVFVNPIFAAIPCDDPGRAMGRLHAFYAWGVVAAIVFGAIFLFLFGGAAWHWLMLILMIVPVITAVLYATCDIPEVKTGSRVSGHSLFADKRMWLCVGAIFLCGAVEFTMGQWSSTYLEMALGIPKIWGDMFGVALFSGMMAIGRTLYAKFGKDLCRVMLLGVIGAGICYLAVVLFNAPIIGLLACIFTGFSVCMLWPGCLVLAPERVPNAGVILYAMMAAGGDLGGSVAPQLVGIITDAVIANPAAAALAERLSLTPDQLGIKLGMLIGLLFAVIAIPVYNYLRKTRVTPAN